MNGLSSQTVIREFPDYEIETRYEALLALYHLRVVAKVLQHHELSVMARFVLRAIALQVATVEEIAQLLGLDPRDLSSAGAELLQADLVIQGPPNAEFERAFSLTELGKRRVQDKAELQLLVPRRRTLHLYFDPLTEELSAVEPDLVSIDRVRKEGRFVIQPPQSRPSLGHIDLDGVRRAISSDRRQDFDFDVVALQSMREPELAYAEGSQVFVLKRRSDGSKRIAVFRGNQYLALQSAAIETLHQNGIRVIPTEAEVPEESVDDVWQSVRSTVAEYADPHTTVELVKNERLREHVQRQLERQEVVYSQTQDDAEREEAERTLKELTAQLAGLEDQRSELARQLAEVSRFRAEFLATEEHRPWLMRALREAEEEVLIISPWINAHTVDNELSTLIYDALKRDVRICVGHGISGRYKSEEDERKERNARYVIDRLRGFTRGRERLLNFYRVDATHQKIVICDRKFAITGSFNWLSYRGDKDDGYRRETSVVLRDPQAVEHLAQTVFDALSTG